MLTNILLALLIVVTTATYAFAGYVYGRMQERRKLSAAIDKVMAKTMKQLKLSDPHLVSGMEDTKSPVERVVEMSTLKGRVDVVGEFLDELAPTRVKPVIQVDIKKVTVPQE